MSSPNKGKAIPRHGGTKKSEYNSWQGMRARCNNPKHPKYPDYGGRGIRVSPVWNYFPAFYADVGPRPSAQHSLDRIDNNGNYEPGNVRWATKKEQVNNRRLKRLEDFSDMELLQELQRRKLTA